MAGREAGARRGRRGRVYLVGVLAGVAVALAAAMSGCGRGENEESPEPSAEAPSYPAGLSAGSSPTEVARVLIEALDENDGETLLGLVAVNAAAKDFDAIYRRHGRRSEIKRMDIPGIVVAGWRLSYSFLQKGETEVGRETVQGDKATVRASVKTRGGDPQTLKISLVREDGLWRVEGGLESE